MSGSFVGFDCAHGLPYGIRKSSELDCERILVSTGNYPLSDTPVFSRFVRTDVHSLDGLTNIEGNRSPYGYQYCDKMICDRSLLSSADYSGAQLVYNVFGYPTSNITPANTILGARPCTFVATPILYSNPDIVWSGSPLLKMDEGTCQCFGYGVPYTPLAGQTYNRLVTADAYFELVN